MSTKRSFQAVFGESRLRVREPFTEDDMVRSRELISLEEEMECWKPNGEELSRALKLLLLLLLLEGWTEVRDWRTDMRSAGRGVVSATAENRFSAKMCLDSGSMVWWRARFSRTLRQHDQREMRIGVTSTSSQLDRMKLAQFSSVGSQRPMMSEMM